VPVVVDERDVATPSRSTAAEIVIHVRYTCAMTINGLGSVTVAHIERVITAMRQAREPVAGPINSHGCHTAGRLKEGGSRPGSARQE
jgi:hypothetical protein